MIMEWETGSSQIPTESFSSQNPTDGTHSPYDLSGNMVRSSEPSLEQPTPDLVQTPIEIQELEEEFYEEVEEVDEGGRRKKKRKKVMFRSPYWKHYIPFRCSVTQWIKGRCKYCRTELLADSRKHGTKSLINHYKSCKAKPKEVESTQNRLRFEAASSTQKGGLFNWNFDQDYVLEGILEMLVIDEMPFRTIEKRGFRRMITRACPMLHIPCRKTVTNNVYKMYLNQKSQLMSFLRAHTQRVSFTTDTWTSIQRNNYMCLTAHFIDDDWILKKRIINFCLISGHTGEDVAQAVEKCLRDWGLDKVFTFTVDNASANDTALGCLTKRLVRRGDCTILGGKYLHIRCIAHIINLVVQDGLKSGEGSTAISRIRMAVKYVKGSPGRYTKFRDCIESERLDTNKLLCLDVPTRWNSTYEMLSAALSLRKAFDRYEMNERSFARDLGSEMPSHFDWIRAQTFVQFLKPFKTLTDNVSGSSYVTSNMVFKEICAIDGLLNKWLQSDDLELIAMSTKMKEKYDKYWGATDKMNMLLYYAVILDPRYKRGYLDFTLTDMYKASPKVGKDLREKIWNGFNELFDEYKKMYEQAIPRSPSRTSTNESSTVTGDMYELHERYMRSMAEKSKQTKSELDKYLQDDCENNVVGFDILKWWKAESNRSPILSKMARDILAVPVSTVASESAFSTGGRVLDPFRSSLTPRLVQAIICYQDWLRDDETPIDVEECVAELEGRDKEFSEMGIDSSILDP